MGLSNQLNGKSKNYLPIIWQSILIGSFILGLVYFPVNIKFDAVSKDIERIKEDHQKHLTESKCKFDKFPEAKMVDIKFNHIKESLDSIQIEISGCRSEDKEFQKTLQEILLKLN